MCGLRSWAFESMPHMPGYEVVRGAASRDRVDAALRLLHADMLHRGIDAKELSEWL